MKNADQWQASKYEFIDGRLRAGRGSRGPALASRSVVDLLAASFERHLPAFARGRLLDLGCGAVPLYEAYRPYVDSLTCVDWGNSLHPNPHLDLEWDLNHPLPYANGSFDTILLSDVLEHLPDPQGMWKEARRLLDRGGHLIISVPFMYWLHEEPHDHFRYTRHQLARAADAAGFEVLVLEPLGDALHVMTDVASKALYAGTASSWHSIKALQAMMALIRRIPAVRRGLTETADRFPLEYVLVARAA